MRKSLNWLLAVACALASAAVQGQEPREPGFNELIVIDPAVQENGLPVPIVEGGKVEIPPTLHVHPYYYCGDKEYQAQILNGGPTIIVANHPRSSEKLYIDAILPAGAPIVAYNAHSITYVYPDRRVIIEFLLLRKDRACVKYVSGHGVVREAQEHFADTTERIRDHKQKSRLASELGELKSDATNIAKGAVGIVATTGAVFVERTRAFTTVLPGIAAIKSAGQQGEERGALEEVRQSGLKRLEEETKTIRTVR